MTEHEQHQQREAYFTSRYRKIAEYWFNTERRAELRDHALDADRRCRFCGRGKTEVRFKKVAHAAPEFLGEGSLRHGSVGHCGRRSSWRGLTAGSGRRAQETRASMSTVRRRATPLLLRPA